MNTLYLKQKAQYMRQEALTALTETKFGTRPQDNPTPFP